VCNNRARKDRRARGRKDAFLSATRQQGVIHRDCLSQGLASHGRVRHPVAQNRRSDAVQPTPNETQTATAWTRRRMVFLSVLVLMVAVITFGVTTLLVSIFERRQEARQLFESSANRSTTAVKPRPGRTG
jgi:hypothetical protein